jgi:putative transcriptional regulator
VKNRLRVLRAELDWSQADLAQRLGVSRQTVNAIETGKYDPSLPLAFSLARTFKRRIEEIFEAEPRQSKRQAADLRFQPGGGGVEVGRRGIIAPLPERE